MRKNCILTLIILFISYLQPSSACTNLIVGKKASADGSVFITYADDLYGKYGSLCHYGAGVYQAGDKLKIYQWSGEHIYLGEIPQVEKTYNVIGNINEHQVAIGETTFTGRKELKDTTAILDYGSLIYIALQRAKTAREAIEVMTSLVKEYGYYSTGESFSIADPNEAWIMEMVGKGPGRKGAVWVAVRIPDDCIAAHANQSRIHQFDRNDKENCLYAPDVISFAREKGYFTGKDKDFSFAKAYSPQTFSRLRACESRVWSFYNRFTDHGDKWLPYILGQDQTPLPLYVKPNRKISLADLQAMMRDHFEGTALDPTKDLGGGAYHSPYRLTNSFTVDSVDYFCERPISTQQTAWSFVAQLRSYLPDPIGGVFWFATDDANMSVYTPVYCATDRVPECYTETEGAADRNTFSFNSSFWVFNWVANQVYPWYDQKINDVRVTQQMLEKTFLQSQAGVEQVAQQLYAENPKEAIAYLTRYTAQTAQTALETWRKLGEYLIVKYADGAIRQMKASETVGSHDNEPKDKFYSRPGFTKEYKKRLAKELVEQYGDKYKKDPVGE